MKLTRLLTIAFLLLAAAICAAPARANQSASGWCEAGAQSVIFGGITSTSKVQASYPSCTVTVYIHGGGLATIYSDSSGTPLSNPFTAGSNGQWTFFAANGIYDVNLSGAGITPTTISSIQLYDCVTAGCSGGSSGGVVQSGPQYSLPIYPNTPSQANVGPSNIVTDSSKNNLTVPGTTTSTGDVLGGASVHPKGPAPFADVTQFGVRALVPNAIPSITGITATISATSTRAAVSTASCPLQISSACFNNGDGVDVAGAGATITMSTPSAPTVTPTNNGLGTGTNLDVAAPAGSATFNYQVFACDLGGGCTAASATGSTSTGNTLGAQSIAITSMSLSNNTMTFNATSPGFSAGTDLRVDGCSGTDVSNFCGYYQAATVTGSSFTATNTIPDTRNGGVAASAGGATAHWFNGNKVCWTAVTGAFRYIIRSDRQNPGTFVNVGMSWPVDQWNAGFTDGTLCWTDYGQTMMANEAGWIPWYAPTNGSATNDLLRTTITAGAGTTSLTFADAAVNSVSGAAIVLDDCPDLLTAMAAHKGPILFPADTNGGTYVTNSVCNVTTNPANPLLFANANTQFNDTLLGNGLKLYGRAIPGTGSSTQFESQSFPNITGKSSPVILMENGNGSIDGLNIGGPGIAVMQDGGGGTSGALYPTGNFLGANGSADYMSMGFVCRGATGGSCIAKFGNVQIEAGAQGTVNQTFTPGFYLDDVGDISIDFWMGNARTIMLKPDDAGSLVRIGGYHTQGPLEPTISTSGIYGVATIIMGDAGQSIIDTGIFTPVFTDNGGTHVYVVCGGGGCGSGTFTGNAIGWSQARNTWGTALDGVFVAPPSTGGASYNLFKPSGAIATNYGYPFFVDPPAPAAPTCSVSAGGSLPIGTYTFSVNPVWWNNAESTASPFSASCSTTSGNQTITITRPTIAGNPKSWDLYYNSGSGITATTAFGNQIAYGTSSIVWSALGTITDYPGTVPAGGPTILGAGTQGVITTKVTTPLQQSNFLYSAAGTPVPTCNAAALGEELIVSDATAPTYMAAYTSGGAITAKVLCSYNGSSYSWLTH